MSSLRKIESLECEVVHHYAPGAGELVTSTGNSIAFRLRGARHTVAVPVVPRSRGLLMPLRLARRAARLDKSNVVLSGDRSSALIAYCGRLYRYDLGSGRLTETGRLRQCRNMLHQGVLAVGEQTFVFGEYGWSVSGRGVPIWKSTDGGRSFSMAYEIPAGKARHVHGVYRDPHTEKLWITTGDIDGQCHILVTDVGFSSVEVLGDGTQAWRAVGLAFSPDEVVWGMDTPLETVYVCHYNRRTGRLRRGEKLPGPVWYVKQLDDDKTLLQTSREKGPGCAGPYAHLFVSEDLARWTEVARFRKDALNQKLFKTGVLGFADGSQSSNDFALFGEALVGFDGKAFRMSLQWATGSDGDA